MLVRELRSRTAVKVHNDINTSVIAPSDQLVQVLDTTSREEFALLNKVFTDPETNWDADCVEPQTLDLGDVVLGDPAAPVLLEGGISSILAEALDTSPFVVESAASHACELVRSHPWLDDELRAEVDTAELVVAGEPSHDAFGVAAEDCVIRKLLSDRQAMMVLFEVLLTLCVGLGSPGAG